MQHSTRNMLISDESSDECGLQPAATRCLGVCVGTVFTQVQWRCSNHVTPLITRHSQKTMNIYRNAVAVGSVAHTHTEAVTHAVKVQVNSGNNTPPQDICAPKSCNVLSDRCLGLVSLTPNGVGTVFTQVFESCDAADHTSQSKQ